jgi:DNA-binding transcriptional MerR regulator
MSAASAGSALVNTAASAPRIHTQTAQQADSRTPTAGAGHRDAAGKINQRTLARETVRFLKGVGVPGLMRIGELAAAAGVSNRTVDFYTNLGLIRPAERTSGGFRLYDPGAVELIATIRQLESSGLALEDIAQQFANASADDLTDILTKLGRDLEALRTVAETAGSAAHGIATTLALRAHHLITMATELLTALPDV